jgi:hypothetical protein
MREKMRTTVISIVLSVDQSIVATLVWFFSLLKTYSISHAYHHSTQLSKKIVSSGIKIK